MPRFSYTYKALNRVAGKAIHRYQMMADGDRIAVGLSGGKDSMTLLWLLAERQLRVPVRYELFPIHIDPGFEGGFADELAAWARDAGHRLSVVPTQCGPIAHSDENLENPCFLCARQRRKHLFEKAAELGCNKLALGHNRDDLIETLFLNICYAGQISTMKPCQPFFDGELTVIRPLAYADEDTIAAFTREAGLPVWTNPCPSAGRSQRKALKTMLGELYRSNPKIKGNIFRALHHVNTEYLLK